MQETLSADCQGKKSHSTWSSASNLPQVLFSSSPICVSKEEYYSKDAIILENLHHQDPGGVKIEYVSGASLESAEVYTLTSRGLGD